MVVSEDNWGSFKKSLMEVAGFQPKPVQNNNNPNVKRSSSLNSLQSLCSTSFSSLEDEAEISPDFLMDVNDKYILPQVPEEDEDEDWRMFGWLLDAAEANDLDSFCKVERKSSCPASISPLYPLSPLEIDVSDDSDWRHNSASPASPKRSDLLVFHKNTTRPWWKSIYSESESESRKRSASSELDSDTETDSDGEMFEERRITRSMSHYLELKRSRKTGASWPQEPAVAEVPPADNTAREPENSASCENLEPTVKLEPASEFSPTLPEKKGTPSDFSGSPTRTSGRQTARLKRLSPGVEESPTKSLIQSICHNGVSIIPPIDMKDIRKSKPGRPSNKDKRKMERQIAIQRKKLTKPGAAKTTVSIDFDVNACHCICRQPYDPKKFYMACNGCKRWFHGKCVNVTEKKAKKLQEWCCTECVPNEFQDSKKKKKPEYTEEESIDGVFCLCRKPYDPSKDYIGCDSCKDWFHFECVKVTHEQTRQINQYVCPICREPEAILEAAKAMQEHEYSGLFSRDGPDGEEFRSKFPDLECIEDIVEKAQEGKYPSLHDFRDEVAAFYTAVSEATDEDHILHRAIKEITTTASDVMLNALPDHPDLP